MSVARCLKITADGLALYFEGDKLAWCCGVPVGLQRFFVSAGKAGICPDSGLGGLVIVERGVGGGSPSTPTPPKRSSSAEDT